jgi:cystathionine beta-lyase/cystathionine gamma-synthase
MKTLFTRFNLRFAAVPAIVLAMLAPVARAGAQTPAADTTQTVQDTGGVTKSAPVAEKPDPLKRRLSDHEERDRRKATVAELKGEYKSSSSSSGCAATRTRIRPTMSFATNSMRASRTRTSILRRASRAG